MRRPATEAGGRCSPAASFRVWISKTAASSKASVSSTLADAGDPVELARRYETEGADELVFLDITATVEGRGATLAVVRAVAAELTIPFAVGGGVKSVDDVNALLRAGCDKVSVNSAALRSPDSSSAAARVFGSQCIVVAIDARAAGDSFEVVVDGGRTPTGRDAIAWAREAERRGAGELLVTSIDRDGTRSGFDLRAAARDPRRGRSAGHRVGRRRQRSPISSTCSRAPAPMPRSPRGCSTTANSRSST